MYKSPRKDGFDLPPKTLEGSIVVLTIDFPCFCLIDSAGPGSFILEPEEDVPDVSRVQHMKDLGSSRGRSRVD